VSVICHIQFQWKATELFQNRIKKIWSGCKKNALGEKVFGNEIRRQVFVV